MIILRWPNFVEVRFSDIIHRTKIVIPTGGTAVLAVPEWRYGFPSHAFCAMNPSSALVPRLVLVMHSQPSAACQSNRLPSNPNKGHSETRSLFERSEESAFLWASCQKQIPRFTRGDNVQTACGMEYVQRSVLPKGRADSAESPCSFRWLFTSRNE